MKNRQGNYLRTGISLRHIPMLKRHFENIITYWTHRISNSFAEGINSVIQHIKATACGFKSFQNYRTSILFYCGGLDLYP
ncbi:MAG: transposase [Treponema sp.]|nr:transposase [Treponema sp.]